jgi:hypothetical protein
MGRTKQNLQVSTRFLHYQIKPDIVSNRKVGFKPNTCLQVSA